MKMIRILFMFALVFAVGTSYAQIKVLNSGLVGVGNDTPVGQLHVINNTTGEHPRFWANDGLANGSHQVAEFYRFAPGNGNAGFNAGYIADGTDVDYTYLYGPGERDFAFLTFFGGIYCPLYATFDGKVGINQQYTPTFNLDVLGNAAKTVGGDLWNVPAAAPNSENEIKSYNKGLEEVMQIRPVTWTSNDKTTSTENVNVGLVGQEYQKIAPDFVQEVEYQSETLTSSDQVDDLASVKVEKGEMESYLSMNATPIKYMLVNAIKEQQAMIKELTAKVAALEASIKK